VLVKLVRLSLVFIKGNLTLHCLCLKPFLSPKMHQIQNAPDLIGGPYSGLTLRIPTFYSKASPMYLSFWRLNYHSMADDGELRNRNVSRPKSWRHATTPMIFYYPILPRYPKYIFSSCKFHWLMNDCRLGQWIVYCFCAHNILTCCHYYAHYLSCIISA